jgi:hypothetical protein
MRMTPVKKPLYRFLLAAFAVLQIFTFTHAQDLEVTVKVSDNIEVVGTFGPDSTIKSRQNLGFLRSRASDAGLAERINDVRMIDAAGGLVKNRKLIEGEYLADSDIKSFAYRVNPSLDNRTAAAHGSWMGESVGILMLDDLLPQFGTQDRKVSARLKLELTSGWRAFFAGGEITGPIVVDDVQNVVIYVGESLRYYPGTTETPQMVISGEWKFADGEAIEQAAEIYGEYAKLFRSKPIALPVVAIIEMPKQQSAGIWVAETRGRNVTIVSKDMPFRTQSVQRLHEQLRHELFHLWIPNSLNLSGDYAWFYEGFALYRSLRLAVDVNRIRFDDLLDALSRAYAIDARQLPRRPLTGPLGPNAPADTQTYARGMIIAFMADLHLLNASRGKQDTAGVLRVIFERHGPGSERTVASTALLKVLPADLTKFVTGTDTIDWTPFLTSAGLQADPERGGALSVVPKPTGKQKAILDRLGYNNWRRVPRRSK